MSTTTSATNASVDFEAIKSRQQATWSSGDYSVIGTTLQLVGETLAETMDVVPGERVLDVAAGNGNASLAAARRGGDVTATDYVSTLLDQTTARARAEGLEIEVRTADAENLPDADATFDAVVSTFGVMFAPNQERAASEMTRVTRPGGRIGLTNWTPDGFIGHMFKIVGRYVPPPAGIASPLGWGDESRLAELFGDRVRSISTTRREFVFRYRSAQHWLDTFRNFYGPMHKAFGALDEPTAQQFERELLDLAEAHNTSTVGAMRVPSSYLEVVAIVAG